jgi:hypothetical protein
VVISLVYSATRHDDWPGILLGALGWGLRMVFFLAVIAANIYVLVAFPLLVFFIFLGAEILAFVVYMLFYPRAN